ncbi:circadian-associated transcriptional repressor-like [Parambassis ranga]|uniref:Circadian-associated transcriptional repressor-like n=1 Tax=Parambassis ranga TaxID=210632 RepID=A0A6P7HEX0_9TELE|nr:circadian-associated transcriptional repressor-like [Parambassis ranga]
MNSLGNSSKWPSYDSLPSNSSFLLSESEHTEDEADVFSEGEVESRVRKSILGDEGITHSGNCLDFPPHPDRDQSEHRPNKTKCPESAFTPGAPTLRSSSSVTPGDLAFAQKCADLNRFVHPLLGLLHGLKSGRFDRGLTSFQQSVAIDRLQRILGILQKPEMGERYLQNLLQIEMLLKMWFPQLTLKSTVTTNQSITPKLAPHWHQNQLHMPVKKRKLSWSDSDHTVKHSHHQHGKHGSCHAATPLNTVSISLPGSPKRQKTPEEEPLKAAGQTFTERISTLIRPSHFCSKTKKQLEISPPSLPGSPAMQDSSVSSSNVITTTDSP